MTWREQGFNHQFRKMREEQHQRVMDDVSKRFYALHASLAEVIKKLMKNANCKERLLKWMRHAVDFNLDKRKMMTNKPVASDGFILNYIDLLLQLCKPFTEKMEKYGNFIQKINCFYLWDNRFVKKATDFDKIESRPEKVQSITDFLQGKSQINSLNLSGQTLCPMVEGSSLLGDGDSSATYTPPNFITECFFLAHVLIALMAKKIEQQYKKNNEEVNTAIDNKDMDEFESAIAQRLCLDVHIFGK